MVVGGCGGAMFRLRRNHHTRSATGRRAGVGWRQRRFAISVNRSPAGSMSMSRPFMIPLSIA